MIRMIFIFMALFIPVAAEADLLNLSQHRFSVGGAASFPISMNVNAVLTAQLNLEPQFGYMVMNNWEVKTEGFVKIPLTSRMQTGETTLLVPWGLGLSSRYFFNTGTLAFPYVGAGFSFEIKNLRSYTATQRYKILSGVLFSLSERIAIDVGMPIEAVFAGALFKQVELRPVFLGFLILF